MINDFSSWPYDYLNVKEAWMKVNKNNLKNLKMAYIDTGYDSEKALSKGANVEIVNLCDNDICMDSLGHGTAFANIFIKYAYLDDTVGPKIISIKSSNNAQVLVSKVEEGISRALEMNVDILAINLCNTCFNSRIAHQLYKAAKSGIITVVPSGNLITNEYTFPASLNTVIACTSVEPSGNISDFANINEYIDVGCPEENLFKNISGIDYNQMQQLLNKMNNNDSSKAKKESAFFNGNFFGTSFSTPILTALITLMKSVNPKLNIFMVKNILKSLSNEETILSDGKSMKIKKVNFLEAIDSAINFHSSVSDYYDEQYFFQVTYKKDSEEYVVIAEVYNLEGKKVDIINKEFELIVFPYNRQNTKEGVNIVKKLNILSKDGIIKWNFNHLQQGKYFLRIKDKDNIILESLSVIKK
ncbi:S8 family serine peptidase [Ruminiclostridium herbifermentans]|uniref:S8 family serine peptidase n=1 Tax=Ruminiclostridium herbifermentans TaxID=2488810 RepID=A0A4U7J6H6_9FIRM|nr:S8 family serine peptidase [Ruminiclostridium herbifermentans]QNU66413.1 S8 family serine peptidase [Ruminiclostridium herbifermentans]